MDDVINEITNKKITKNSFIFFESFLIPVSGKILYLSGINILAPLTWTRNRVFENSLKLVLCVFVCVLLYWAQFT